MGGEPHMTWRWFQRVIWTLLAVCAGGAALLLLTSGRGLLLTGQVSGGDIMAVLGMVFLLTLLVWGDGAIAAFLKGWERVLALAFALTVEALALLTLLFFGFYFNTSPEYIPLRGPTGETELVVCEENWLFKVWGSFYRPVGPFWIQSTGVSYEARDCWPFRGDRYEIEWAEGQAIIHYDTGTGEWETCTVPLNQ